MKITELFKPQNAKSRNLTGYAEGDTPFVSNSNLNNGIVRYVDADFEKEVINAPCVAVNGFGFATVQLNPFIGAGNGGVHIIALHPLKEMSVIELAYYAAQINHASWRFSYGRRAIQRRLLQIELKEFDMSKTEQNKFLKDFRDKAEGSLESVISLT
jgi:type I restriction enzyme M protein